MCSARTQGGQLCFSVVVSCVRACICYLPSAFLHLCSPKRVLARTTRLLLYAVCTLCFLFRLSWLPSSVMCYMVDFLLVSPGTRRVEYISAVMQSRVGSVG